MLEKITPRYGNFPDSLIERIIFYPITGSTESNVEVLLSCYNIKNEMKKEMIKLSFKKIKQIKLSQLNDNPSLFLNEIYIENKNDLITFDFFPIDHFDYLEENPNSSFIIKCSEIDFEVLE
ncbi:hypothetical protein [Flavobacterium flavigenum]|uniref:hypothetical protein n=1 Tax=Flavobacterium flavigenum TaxID=3003258 RepID=UPI00248296AE|nr:hypothetical protein [Flavobacterium flavigenum]